MSKQAKKYLASGPDQSSSGHSVENLQAYLPHINFVPILSEAWLQCATAIEAFANTCQEELLKEAPEELGRSAHGNLWDSNRASLKLLYEGQRVCVLLELLRAYYAWRHIPTTATEKLACATQFNRSVEDIDNKLTAFEAQTTLLLAQLFENPECLAGWNIVTLLEFICECFANLKTLCGDYEYKVEVGAWRFLIGINKNIETIDKRGILAAYRSLEIPTKAITSYLENAERLPRAIHLLCLEGLGSLAAVDEISDDLPFAQTQEQKTQLVNWRQGLIREILVEFSDRRGEISPFLDIIDQYEKALRFGAR